MSISERQQGMTLIELILFIIIVGVALAGVLSVFNVATRHSADPLVRKQAVAIAESLLEELWATPYACPSGATCSAVTTTNRTQAHQLADYHGFTMTGISAIDGTPIAHLSGYVASIAVTPATLNGRAGQAISITVSRGDESVTLDAWRGQY